MDTSKEQDVSALEQLELIIESVAQRNARCIPPAIHFPSCCQNHGQFTLTFHIMQPRTVLGMFSVPFYCFLPFDLED
jgi:hypothetical protein